MLLLDDDVRAALEGPHTPGYAVSSFYGADLKLPSVPITSDGSITFSESQQIPSGGTVSVARDGDVSYVPKTFTDPLAPFGQELSIDRTITVGTQTWSIPLGRFRIVDVPDSKEYFVKYPSLLKKVGWEVQLSLHDRFDILAADDFLGTTGPTPGNSTWSELQALSAIPVVPSLPDKPVPSGLTYQSKYDAIVQLIGNLGGVPHITRQGALTARIADAWLTQSVHVFTINGTTELDDGMSNDVYNSVVVTTSKDPNIVGVAEISDPSNPLCVTGPLGRRVYKKQDPLIESQAAADAAAATYRDRLSTQRSKVCKVTCLPRPDLELGDYGTVIDEARGREVTGEISDMSFSMDATAAMTLSLIVAEVTVV